MASGKRFDLASTSAEGTFFAAAYLNGQRGAYSGPNLDRSGSFRESIENRGLKSAPNSSRGGISSNAEIPLLAQCLMLEPFLIGDRKFFRFGELRRLFAALGIMSEDQSLGAAHSKPVPSIALEEIKHLRASLLETSTMARDRLKMLNESIVKLDKYRHTILSRKRPQNENSSSERSNDILSGDRSASGANLLKMGMQNHQNSSELAPQRSEDKNKNVVPNKRIRTSIVEVRSDGRFMGFPRASGVIDKDRDMLKSGNGTSMQGEDKARGLPTGGDGWEKRMKRKHSVGTMVARTMDGDRELKRGMPHRLNNETRLRSCAGHGFRSGISSNGIIGVSKLDGRTQPNCLSARTMSRNDLDNVSLANDKRDRAVGSEKDRFTNQGNNKLNVLEDNQVGSPTPVTKGKASRAPRMDSGVLANPSPNFPRTSGALGGWEYSSSTNKVQAIGGVGNRKRPMPTRSSSPPVAQWVGQRPQKISRVARRSLVPPVLNRDESQIVSKGFPALDAGSRLNSCEANEDGFPKRASNNTQPFKLKLENALSPAGFSESEESGAGENKSKEKAKRSRDIEERAVNGIQKVATFISSTKKNKIHLNEESGDGVRRQGRSGRGSAQSRAFLPLMREKLECGAMAKPLRSTRPSPDKTESKSGRPPTKKFSDCKAFSRPGVVVNSGSSEFTGESEDDHGELVAAATFARNASYFACSSSFWKKMEPFFAFISSEDVAYLKQQVCLVEKFEGSLSHMSGTDKMGKGRNYLTRTVQNESARTASSFDESRDIDTLPGKSGTERWFEKIIPLSQRLLAALIIGDETDEFNINNGREGDFPYSSDDSPSSHIDSGPRDTGRMESEIESELEVKSTASNNFRSPYNCSYLNNDEALLEDDILVHSEARAYTALWQNNIDGSQHMHSVISGISSIECQYQQMALDERILSELHNIGLFPETVQEDGDIIKDISELKEGLYQQTRKMEGQLWKLEKAILKGREMEERELERFAMNKLVEMAYRKHMDCRGNNSSSNKGGVSKVAKQAALAFTKRTLARYQKFEDIGKNCFSEPAFQDGIFSAPPCNSDSKCVFSIREGRANLYAEAINCQLESRASGVMAERCGHINGDIDGDPSNAFRTLAPTSDQSFAKDEPLSSRGKKQELLLEDVVNAAPRAISTFGTSLLDVTKGKRSERDRDQNKEISTRNSTAKAGRPLLGNVRVERKNKTKLRQKTAQLSTSVNGLLGRLPETSSSILPSQESCQTVINRSSNLNGEAGLQGPDGLAQGSFNDLGEPIDLTNMPQHGIASIEELGVSDDLGSQGQDLSSWLNFDDDGLQDDDFMGLEVPMDDLSELNMII